MKHGLNTDLIEKIPPRTYEVQAGHILGLQVLQDWVDWADESIVAGYDSPSLRILAGLQPPFDDHEVNRLAKKAFAELKIVSLTKDNCSPFCIEPILRKATQGKLTKKEALEKLKDLCLATGYGKPFMNFYLLYFDNE